MISKDEAKSLTLLLLSHPFERRLDHLFTYTQQIHVPKGAPRGKSCLGAH